MFSTKKWIAQAVIEASPKQVFKALLEGHKVNGELPPNSHYFNVDSNTLTITMRGHYWYEGIITVTSHTKGSLVTYKVNNIGPKSKIMPKVSKWMVPIWQYRLPKQMKESLTSSISVISKLLNSKGYMVQ